MGLEAWFRQCSCQYQRGEIIALDADRGIAPQSVAACIEVRFLEGIAPVLQVRESLPGNTLLAEIDLAFQGVTWMVDSHTREIILFTKDWPNDIPGYPVKQLGIHRDFLKQTHRIYHKFLVDDQGVDAQDFVLLERFLEKLGKGMQRKKKETRIVQAEDFDSINSFLLRLDTDSELQDYYKTIEKIWESITLENDRNKPKEHAEPQKKRRRVAETKEPRSTFNPGL